MSNELRFIGPPGCGKTTELTRRALQAVNRYGGEEVMVCSLTKAAGAQVGQEIRKQGIPIPERSIGTLHSFAYHALQVEKDQIADSPKRLKDWNEHIETEGHPYFRITSDAPDVDESAIENSWGGETLGDRCLAQLQVARARMQSLESQTEFVQQFAEEWRQWKSDNDFLDFTDLLETCLADVSTAPSAPSVIFMDEAQDTSMLGMRLLRKWGTQAEYLVIFGDPLQNLYAWAGTDPDAFTTPDVEDRYKRVLSQSWRVPRAVHAHALRWIEPLKTALETDLGKPIEYQPRDYEGAVRRLGGTHFRYPELALRDAQQYLDEGKSVMFLAACSHMLDPLLAVLRREGIPFHNPWRVKRGDWNPLASRKGFGPKERVLSFLRPHGETWGEQATTWNALDLWRWVEVLEADEVLVRGAKKEIEAQAKMAVGVDQPLDIDQVLAWFDRDHLLGALEAAESGDLDWLEGHVLGSKLKSLLFPMRVFRCRGADALRRKPQVIVGTIHSLKGSEADVVYVFPDLSQSAMLEWLRPGVGHDGILRAFYVAFTRARETLVLCGQASELAVRLH